MSLDKGIEHGKERRRPYRHGKAVDKSCRNHGSCPWCQGNRRHATEMRRQRAEAQMKDEDWFRYDISFCSNGGECQQRKTCRRWMTDREKDKAVGVLLSYTPFYRPGGECVHYWRR